jgi:hypothetical protein
VLLCVQVFPGCTAEKVVIYQTCSILRFVGNECFVLRCLVNYGLCLDNVSSDFGEKVDKKLEKVYLNRSTGQFW